MANDQNELNTVIDVDETYDLEYTGEQTDEAIGLALYPQLKFGIDDNGVYVKYAI